MSRSDASTRKRNTYEKAKRCFKTYDKFAMVDISNVVSTQLKQHIVGWGKDVEFLMGKNTLIIKALKEIPNTEEIVKRIKHNVAVVFFKNDIKDIKAVIENNARESFAKEGDTSQKDVWVESCITNMTADKTSYFQILGIATKITKGKVEIISPYKVLSTNDKVGPSQANLLSLLNIKPFVYKMKIISIYEDRQFYEPFVLDIKPEDILGHVRNAIMETAALSLGLDILTKASLPYVMTNAYRNILGVALALNFETKETQALLAQ